MKCPPGGSLVFQPQLMSRSGNSNIKLNTIAPLIKKRVIYILLHILHIYIYTYTYVLYVSSDGDSLYARLHATSTVSLHQQLVS